MITIKFLTPEFGDRQKQMTIPQFLDLYNTKLKGNFDIFSDDTNIPIEERTSIKQADLQNLQENQSLIAVPRMWGG